MEILTQITTLLIFFFNQFICDAYMSKNSQKMDENSNSPTQQWKYKPRKTPCKPPDEKQHNMRARITYFHTVTLSNIQPSGIVSCQLWRNQPHLNNISARNFLNNPNKGVLFNRVRCNSYVLKIVKIVIPRTRHTQR